MSTANWGAKKTSFFALSSNLMDDVSEIVILNENGYYLLLKVYSDCYRFSVLVTFHTKLKWTTEISNRDILTYVSVWLQIIWGKSYFESREIIVKGHY